MRISASLTTLLALGAMSGCANTAPPDVAPNVDAGGTRGRCCPSTLDLLFIVDDSNSMSEEQALLAAQLPRLVRALASGDVEGDEIIDFPPVDALHIGVVTTDLGIGGYEFPSCTLPFGDDGVMRTTSGGAAALCGGTFPRFLSYSADTGPELSEFAADFAQTPIARYVDGFLALEPNPERLVSATITGVPADLEGAS